MFYFVPEYFGDPSTSIEDSLFESLDDGFACAVECGILRHAPEGGYEFTDGTPFVLGVHALMYDAE